MLARIATTIIGVVLVVYGFIAAVSPLPLGVPLVVLGLIMVAAANPAARPLILNMRRRWRWFDKLAREAARRSPKRFRATFDATDPVSNQQETALRKDGDKRR